MRFVVTLLCVLSMGGVAIGQDHPNEDYDLEKIADDIFAIQSAEGDYSELYENLVLQLSNPIDLNKATDEQLRALFVLSEKQINHFIDYRLKQGKLLSKYELQAIPGFDLATISRMSPFVTVNTAGLSFRSIIRRILHEKNNYFLFRIGSTLEKKRGYLKDSTNNAAYEGSPYQIYSRFRVARANDFSIGVTFEKDAGESFKWLPDQGWWGFDYSSGHIQVSNKGIFDNIIVGDYQAQFGQGLILGAGLGFGKGAEPVTTVRRSNLGFIPYTSLNESGFMRGVAVNIKPVKRVSVSSFFSYREQDGNRPADEPTRLSSIVSSGFHRTASEVKNRKSFSEMNYGAIVSYKTKKLEVGALFHAMHLSTPLSKIVKPYNRFDFSGDRNINLGFFLNYTWANFTFFGEVATSLQQGIAYTAGIAGSLSAKFDLALVHRRYDKNFYTFYGNAFGENTNQRNESGYYIGWKYAISKRYALSGYIDLFRFPWLRYRGYSPSMGEEWLIRFSAKPSKAVSCYVQVRGESKSRNLPSSNLFPTANGSKYNCWLNCDYTVSPHLSFKSRIQYSTYILGKNQTNGLAIIQDMNFKMGRFRLSLRHAFFDTDDYENRQYVYERNVWLAFSLPAYYGVGIRNYALLQYTLSKKIAFWVRWSRTYYIDRSTIGSGFEAIEGNSKNDVIFQARIKL